MQNARVTDSKTITVVLTPQAISRIDESHWPSSLRFNLPELDKVLEKHRCTHIQPLLPPENRNLLDPKSPLARTFVLIFEPPVIIETVCQELLETPYVEKAAPPNRYFLKLTQVATHRFSVIASEAKQSRIR